MERVFLRLLSEIRKTLANSGLKKFTKNSVSPITSDPFSVNKKRKVNRLTQRAILGDILRISSPY